MRVGDIEYTRHFRVGSDTAQESHSVDITFALGIKVRALLTRIHCFSESASAVTSLAQAFFENGQAVGQDQTQSVLAQDPRLATIGGIDMALATNGMGFSWFQETLWWKILLPGVRIHVVDTVLGGTAITGTLHYRFAELTDDEIIEIAAQRAQG